MSVSLNRDSIQRTGWSLYLNKKNCWRISIDLTVIMLVTKEGGIHGHRHHLVSVLEERFVRHGFSSMCTQTCLRSC